MKKRSDLYICAAWFVIGFSWALILLEIFGFNDY